MMAAACSQSSERFFKCGCACWRATASTCKNGQSLMQAYWEISKKLLIVPYVPGSTDSNEPLQGFKTPILPLEERQTLLFFRATCLPYMFMYPNNTRITTGKVCTLHIAA